MKKQTSHSSLAYTDKQSKVFFAGGTFNWEKSADEVWQNIEASIVDSPRRTLRSLHAFALSAAAITVLLIGLSIFFYTHTQTITVPAGQHASANLPDGSTVQLNAQSEIHFKPYWWYIKREAFFEGEALFEVEKGQTFTVKSTGGATQVVGTSFNIYARPNSYRVTCLTGMVKVLSPSNQEAYLSPNSRATILPNGHIETEENIDTLPEISWKNNYFRFTATPLIEVLNEIERQYNVHIELDAVTAANYTGNFSRQHNVEEVLELICPALGLNFIQTASDTYRITPDNE